MNIRSAMQILPEIRDGHAIVELSQHIHNAIAAVKEHGKPAKVYLELTIAPGGKGYENLIEAPLLFTGEAYSKLPEPDPIKTLMFVDADGNPTRNPAERQKDLGLTVAGAKPIDKSA